MSPPRGCQGCARHSVLDTGRADDLHERHLTTWTGRAPWVDTGVIDGVRADPGAVQGWPNEDPELIAVLLRYAATMFVGATLLFVVQPMVGKMILPLLGGTPAVWSTCMVFFQAVLLGGYAYAHASSARLGVRRQMLLHLVLMLLPLAVLPLAVNPSLLRRGVANPILDVLLLLSLSVGLPFLVVSATAPLLQKWFSHTAHAPARRGLADPDAPLERVLPRAPRPHRAVCPRPLAARPGAAARGDGDTQRAARAASERAAVSP